MAAVTSSSRPVASPSVKPQLASMTKERGTWGKPTAMVVILLAAFFLLQSQIPLRTTVQIGADEGFELAKVTLVSKGYKLYSEVWNDQPPLHTFLVAQVIKRLPPLLGARLVTTAFTAVLLASVFVMVGRTSGWRMGAITVGLLILSPGFLELSASCMLEIPALAVALAGLAVLVVGPQTGWRVIAGFAGVLFGLAALIKLVPLYLLPLAALLLWWRQPTAKFPSERTGSSPIVFASSMDWRRFQSLLVSLGVLGASLMVSLVFTDWLIEAGAFLKHFQQSWASHFGGVQSYEYGSPAEHSFEWSIMLKNWDATAPAVLGMIVSVTRLRKSHYAILPLVWLALALIVFTNHKPWWSYYYVHIAIPLCWCAAIGLETAYAFILKRLAGLKRGKRKSGRMVGLRIIGGAGAATLLTLLLVGWMGARVYLQIVALRGLPQLHAALVLREIEPLKPFSRWLYTDQLVYSFHADLPLPPPLAVVPLKRLWSGDMTNARIAAEIERFKPEIILLRNDNQATSFQELLNLEYRLIYQDTNQRLYATPAVIKRAQEARNGNVSSLSPQVVLVQEL